MKAGAALCRAELRHIMSRSDRRCVSFECCCRQRVTSCARLPSTSVPDCRQLCFIRLSPPHRDRAVTERLLKPPLFREYVAKMMPTLDSRHRFCGGCKRQVVLCETDEQLVEALRQNACVAIPEELLHGRSNIDSASFAVGEPSPYVAGTLDDGALPYKP